MGSWFGMGRAVAESSLDMLPLISYIPVVVEEEEPPLVTRVSSSSFSSAGSSDLAPSDWSGRTMMPMTRNNLQEEFGGLLLLPDEP